MSTETNPEPAEGQVPAGDYQPVPEQVSEESTAAKKSNEEIAQEVIAGHWGRGQNRKRRLQDAGYDVSEISTEMTKIFNQ